MTGPGRNIGYRHMHQRLRMRHDLPVTRYLFLVPPVLFVNAVPIEGYMGAFGRQVPYERTFLVTSRYFGSHCLIHTILNTLSLHRKSTE